MLIRPSPYPEELDRGYLGRVMRVNGKSTEKDTVTLMSVWAGAADKHQFELPCLELLSKVAGTDVPTFVRQHSTLPLRRSITAFLPSVPHGSEEYPSILWKSGMHHARAGAYFCAECANDDQNFHGQSYWRREHQVPGIFWCSKHAKPLMCAEDEAAFLQPPAQQLQCSKPIDEAWIKQLLNNKAVQRYSEICSGLLETKMPVKIRHVSVMLKKQARLLGLQTQGVEGNSPLLSDALIAEFGREWLSMVMPELSNKPEGIILHNVDTVIFAKRSAASTIAYILALAALYDSADAALNAIQLRPVTLTKPLQPSIKFTRDELINTYIHGSGDYSTIASVLPVSKLSISTQLKAVGLPNLIQNSKRNIFKAVLAFYVEKKPLQASAEKGNISVAAMEELIRNAGCDLTRALQAMQRPDGRGTGGRRARQLTPGEAISVKRPEATKFSPKIRREQLLAQELRARAGEECRT